MLKIQKLKGIEIAVIGIFLLLVKLLISLFLGTPKTLEDIDFYYNVLKLENVLQFLGLALIFSGIVWMIYDFYQKWREDTKEIKDNINTLLKYQVDKDIKDFEKSKKKK